MNAVTKVNTPLMERYMITCTSCGYLRQVFGTEPEARNSAEQMGWEFRFTKTNVVPDQFGERFTLNEVAYCPHCKLLVKQT